MARTSSAKKAQRAALRRRVFNARRNKAMKDSVKAITKLVASKDAKAAGAMMPAFFKAIDKATKNGNIHANTAARMKSRIAKRMRTLSS